MHSYDRKLTHKELYTAEARITLTVKEIAKHDGVSPSAINARCDSVLFKTHSQNIREAIYKLTKAGVITLAICSVLSGTFSPAKPNTRRRAPKRPAISYQVKFIEGASA